MPHSPAPQRIREQQLWEGPAPQVPSATQLFVCTLGLSLAEQNRAAKCWAVGGVTESRDCLSRWGETD